MVPASQKRSQSENIWVLAFDITFPMCRLETFCKLHVSLYLEAYEVIKLIGKQNSEQGPHKHYWDSIVK